MHWRERGWPYAVLLAEVLAFYRHVLFSGGFVIPWDLRYYHFPLASFVAKSFRHGELPLWDPFTYCGRPIYANLTTQLFYPPTTLAVIASNWWDQDRLLYFLELQLIGHVFLAGVFAYWLLRRLEIGRLGALIGATVFQLGGFFASQTQHLGAVDAAAWLPLTWLCVIALRQTPRLRHVAVLAFSLSMAILAGFPAVTAVVFGGCLLLALACIIFRQASPKLGLYVLAAFLWAGLLAAVQLLPTIELTRRSVAAFRSDFLGTGGGLPLQSLVSLIAPNHYSVFDLKHYTLPWNPTFLYAYCGIFGLIFAAVGALRKSRFSKTFLTITVIAALWMLGDATPIGRAAFLALPAMIRSSLYPEFALVLFVAGMAVLAGLGAERCGKLVVRRAWGGVLLAATAIDLIAVSSNRPMNTASIREEPGVAYQHLDGSRLVAERMRALVNQTTPPARIDTIDDSLNWASASSLLEVPTANGNDPFALVRLMQVRLAFCQGERWGRYYQVTNPSSPVLDLLNVRFLVSRTPAPGANANLEKAADLPGREVYENRKVLPRFFLVSRVRTVANMDQGLAVLRSPEFNPRELAVVESAAPFENADRLEIHPPVEVLRYAPREIWLRIEAPHPAFLVTSETYYPGWRAYLDGHEQPLALTNVAFRGLAVPRGLHRLEMRFDPPVLWRGAAATAVAGCALLWAFASAIMKKTPWSS